MIEYWCSRQCVVITMEAFCLALVCLVCWPCVTGWGVLTSSSVCCCMLLSVLAVVEKRASEDLSTWSALNERFNLYAGNRPSQVHLEFNSADVIKKNKQKQHVTILSNQIPETAYLIFYWFVLKFLFWDFKLLYVWMFLTYLCFPNGL